MAVTRRRKAEKLRPATSSEYGAAAAPGNGSAELSVQHHCEGRGLRSLSGSRGRPRFGLLSLLGAEGCADRERWPCEGRCQQPPVSLLQGAAAPPAGDSRRRSADPARRPAGRIHRRTHTRIRAHTYSQPAAAAAAMLVSRSGKFSARPGHGPQCSQVSASRTLRASPSSSAGEGAAHAAPWHGAW